jgi:glycosyltransferase involved in cell wall biosynthesis
MHAPHLNKMKKIYYIANIRFPTERAHGIQIAEMCQAFAQNGYEVELVVPNRKTSITDDPYSYYDVKENFKIKKLRTLDLVKWGRIGFWIQSLTFAERVAWYLINKEGVFYTRDEITAVAVSLVGKKITWEAHMGHKNLLVRSLITLRTKFVVITHGLKELYESMGVPESHLLVAPDGADIDRFDIDISKEEARQKLGLPVDKTIVLYKGSLEAWKGAGTVAESAQYTVSSDLIFVFIGGKPEDVALFKEQYAEIPNLLILGNRPRKETPIYQKAADILVIPNSAKEDISKLYTSPMKLFGYMAGGVPIIASDLPSIKEILDELQAYFFTPDDPKSLAMEIDKVLREPETARGKAAQALETVRAYSWKSRAELIIHFIS